MVIYFFEKSNLETLTEGSTMSKGSVTENRIHSGSLKQRWTYFTVQHGHARGHVAKETHSRLSFQELPEAIDLLILLNSVFGKHM